MHTNVIYPSFFFHFLAIDRSIDRSLLRKYDPFFFYQSISSGRQQLSLAVHGCCFAVGLFVHAFCGGPPN